MKCFNHDNIDAVSICVECGRGLCLNCSNIFKVTNKVYCPGCSATLIKDPTITIPVLKQLENRERKD